MDYEVKDIIKLVDDRPVLNEEMLELGRYMCKKTLAPLTMCYQTMLPRALKAREKTSINKKFVKYLKVVKEGDLTSEKQKMVLEYVKAHEFCFKK